MSKKSTTPTEVQLYTDGACSGNPGPGGWAFILRHPASGKELVRSGALRQTTNNQMEMQAVIEGLSALKRPTTVTLYSDSTYVLQGIKDWMPKWKANGWRRRDGNRLVPVKNVELWQRLDELNAQHDITFKHVRGHSGHPENEKCDQLAVAAYQQFK